MRKRLFEIGIHIGERNKMLKDIFIEDEVEMLPVICEDETYYIPHGIKAEKNIKIVTQKRRIKQCITRNCFKRL